MNASRANLQASMNLAARSIEDAADLVRRQLNAVREIAAQGITTSSSGDTAVPVPARAVRYECCDRQLQHILDLSCQCLEVTAKAQTELVRLMQDNYQHMNEAVMLSLDAPAAWDTTLKSTFKRA